MRLDTEHLSTWFLIPPLIWTIGFLLIYLPFFHFLLGFQVTKIAVSTAIGCGGHLAVTPWLYSARPTAQNPDGDKVQTGMAVVVWLSSSILVVVFYIQRDWPVDEHAQLFRYCFFGTTILAAVIALIALKAISRSRKP